MNQNQEGATAKIVQFPARGRFARATADAQLRAVDAPSISFGGGWYHDEAIEAERTRKN